MVVSGAKLIGTTNGLRIKTWQGGSGYAKNIVFKNVLMNNVTNPIIIDQHYCDQEEPCQDQVMLSCQICRIFLLLASICNPYR